MAKVFPRPVSADTGGIVQEMASSPSKKCRIWHVDTAHRIQLLILGWSVMRQTPIHLRPPYGMPEKKNA